MRKIGEMIALIKRAIDCPGQFKEVWTKDGTRYIAFIPDEDIPESWCGEKFDAEIKNRNW